jgi:hypothetical protein
MKTTGAERHDGPRRDHVGRQGKGWGPGRVEPGGRTENPAGPEFPSFEAFLEKRRPGQPFVYWFGSSDPHRDYDEGKGAASGIDLGAIRLFPQFPEAREVRSDVADYYWEVQRFDSGSRPTPTTAAAR